MKAFSMNAESMGKRALIAVASLSLAMGGFSARAQDAHRVQPQATAEDVLASLVHQSAVIFAGEVYAIRMPQSMKNAAGASGGLPSSRPDAVEVEFRVDVGIRGTSIGSNYILRMPVSTWQQQAPFTVHERSVTFLKAPDASGLSGPVEGEADIPGMDLGVLPVDNANQVDLNRLQRMVTRKTITAATMLPPPADPSQPISQAPNVTDVTTTAGEDTLISGSSEGRMPELRGSTVPFLALVRDISVLTAAENQQPNGTSGTPAK